MEKTTRVQDLPGGKKRFTTCYLTDPCAARGQESVFLQHELLSHLAANPQLCLAGTARFEELRVFHNGAQWVAELKATGDLP